MMVPYVVRPSEPDHHRRFRGDNVSIRERDQDDAKQERYSRDAPNAAVRILTI